MVDVKQWIAWIIASATAAVSVIQYAHSQFQSKEYAKETAQIVQSRLDRIENKLDILMQRPAR